MSQRKDRTKIETLAEKYVKKEKYEEAIAEYQKLLSGDEQDVQIWNITGDLFIKANKKDKAVGEFKKIADHFEERGVFTKCIATYKRMSRLASDDVQILKKLADLYCERGFVSEAKAEYSNLAQKLTHAKESKEAAETYKKLLKLDSNDVESRLSLAEIFIQERKVDKAVDELNEAAELKMRSNALKEAGQILKKARSLSKDHPRTLENLIDLLKQENKKKEALKLVNEVLRKDKENQKALRILGDLCFEDKELKKAEEIYKKILSLQPKDVEAVVRLGRIHILNKKFDEAFDVYEPLVDLLVRKHKDDKAIGLLGLVLMAKKDHLPSLEKLADIYKEINQNENYEIVARKLQSEYKKKKMDEKMASIDKKLAAIMPGKEKGKAVPEEISPEKAEPEKVEPQKVEPVKDKAEEARAEEAEPGSDEPDIVGADPTVPEPAEETADEMILADLEHADGFIQQGLIRNARKILEDLRTRYPDDDRVAEKIKALEDITSQMKDEELVEADEKPPKKDTEKFERGEKLTSAEIFADTDIVPLVSQETGEKRYFDLSRQLEEELDAIGKIFYQQTRGDTTIVEKELSAIVSDFKIKVDKKIGTVDLEARYNLGIAYLEQDLIEDAIKEFLLASQDKKWELESFTNLGECYKRQNDFSEAIKWYEKAMKLVGMDSVQAYALKYEIASLYEAKMESDKALQLFGEVLEWNPDYGDVTTRIKNIQQRSSK
jgi:tetratricopeptide (TPR) repeat protein